ncbi:MAG TPA: RsmE family RNA methyltransferase [Chitinophagales bacterium]
MQLYFHSDLSTETVELSEEESAHLRVLRVNTGDVIWLTDGNGTLAESEIFAVNKKTIAVRVKNRQNQSKIQPELHLAISLLKNNERIEWLLEKAVEMGIAAFYPFVAQRSERKNVNEERLKKVALSAAKQSNRAHFPIIAPVQTFDKLIKQNFDGGKFICHCNEQTKPINECLKKGEKSLILIGAEGDFSPAEIEAALKQNFQPMSLGNARLRSETAGLYATASFKFIND